MAGSRQSKSAVATNNSVPGAPNRISFAKLREPLEVPGLLDVQTDSFEWLIGAPRWREAAAARGEATGSANPVGGLEEVLTELSPIEDFSGSMSLSFSDPRFDEVKAPVDECKDKDMTYAAPLFVTAEFINNNTGEIKSQTVFMGDFPMMTEKGTFIINGTERVVVSQLVRSPGVYFDESIDKSTEKLLHSVKVIPSRGAWLEFDVDKRDTVGVRIDRKRRQPVTVLLKALGWTNEQITERFGFSEIMMFVTAEFINNNTGEIKSQTVFMGDFPMMTEKGTFIINGTERVVVSQLVRSPGVYFDESIDKSTEKLLHSVKVIPSRGAWLEFDVDKRDTVGVRIDRKRRQPVTVLLKALGWTNEQITERFGFSEIMMSTLEKDNTAGTDEALLDIYRKLRPGEPPTKESAQTLLENLFFKEKRYDLARVGRYKVNKKLGLHTGEPITSSTLTEEDVVATIEYLVRLHEGQATMTVPGGTEVPVETDDIDHFGNRRLRTVGELIQNQIRVGMSRMATTSVTAGCAPWAS